MKFLLFAGELLLERPSQNVGCEKGLIGCGGQSQSGQVVSAPCGIDVNPKMRAFKLTVKNTEKTILILSVQLTLSGFGRVMWLVIRHLHDNCRGQRDVVKRFGNSKMELILSIHFVQAGQETFKLNSKQRLKTEDTVKGSITSSWTFWMLGLHDFFFIVC